MAEYIEREALLKWAREFYPNNLQFASAVINAPAADVTEVRHGKWLDCIETGTSVAGINITALTGYKCSLCGRYEGKKEPYCNCGAKMNLGDDEK